jgi:hypothetical protein
MSSVRTILVSLLLAAVVGAQGGASSRPLGYRTFIETHLLDRSPVVARARFVKEDDFVGVQVCVYEAKATLKGPPQNRIMIAGAGADTAAARTVDRLLFCEPMSSGVLYRLIDAVDLVEPAAETEAAVRRALDLAAERRPEMRRAGVRTTVFEGLDARGEFSRKLGAREFARASTGLPGAFTAADLPRLRAALPRLPVDERAGFLEALGALEAERLSGYVGAEAAIPAGRERELFLLAVEALKEAPTPAERTSVVEQIVVRYGRRSAAFLTAAAGDPRQDVRLAAYRLLGALDVHDAAPVALRAFGRAEGAERTAIAECLGRVGGHECVPALAAKLDLRAADAPTFLLAIRRIGGPAADRVLDAAEKKAAEDPAASVAAAALAELRAADWQEKDAASRAAARRRALGQPLGG